MPTIERIKELIIRHCQGTLDAIEQQELQAWMNESEDNRETAKTFLDDDLLLAELKNFYINKERIWVKVREALPDEKPAYIFRWKKILVAAVILIVLGGS